MYISKDAHVPRDGRAQAYVSNDILLQIILQRIVRKTYLEHRTLRIDSSFGRTVHVGMK